MTIDNPFRKLLWTATLGGLAGLALNVGCLINVGPLDCSECGNNGCHSQQVGNECKCDLGYEFANDDPGDFECDRIPGKGGDSNCGGESNIHMEGQSCVCDDGYNWCFPNDANDLTCCIDEDQAPGTGGETINATDDTGTTGGTADTTVDDTGDPMMCEEVEAPNNGVEPAAEECTEDGLVFCSNNDTEGPAGSRYWECTGGVWTEAPDVGDQSCQFDGFTFSYGCVDDGVSVTFVCGDGPGTPCSGPECDACADADVIEFCDNGKLGSDSCQRVCGEDGIDGVQFDNGVCVVDGSVPDCCCFDDGDEANCM